jgi:hypothetical protein
MEVRLCVKEGTDISVIEQVFGEMSEASPRVCDEIDYYLGGDEDDEDDEGNTFEWLEHDEAIAFCGFCCGAIPESTPWIASNGNWQQGMISQKNFDRYAMSEEDKAERLRISSIYWGAQKEGEAVAQGKLPAEARAALNQLLDAAK